MINKQLQKMEEDHTLITVKAKQKFYIKSFCSKELHLEQHWNLLKGSVTIHYNLFFKYNEEVPTWYSMFLKYDEEVTTWHSMFLEYNKR